jgi:hypothetical protein
MNDAGSGSTQPIGFAALASGLAMTVNALIQMG